MSSSKSPLVSLRSAFILVVALLLGLAGGGLTYLVIHSQPAAVLAGGGVFGSSVALLHKLIGT